jgi:transcriptional regulator with XRE-family HTH domain
MSDQTEDKASLVMEIAPGLSKHMKSLRKKRSWSQTDLAERLGVHLTHINRVETGKVLPSLDFAVKLSRTFGISLDELLADDGDPMEEVHLEDKNLAERVRLLNSLEQEERAALFKVMDSMLTKQRIRQALGEQVA